MRTLGWALPIAVFATMFVACQEDTSSSTSAASNDDDSSGSANGGSGGTGGQQQGGSGPSTGGTGGTGVGGSGGSGGAVADPCADVAEPSVLINEVVTGGVNAEFFEIWNPGTAAVDLSNYFISDNSTYYSIAEGTAFTPTTSNPGTDFLVQFPADTQIGPDEVLVVATGTDFYGAWETCPDFVLPGVSTDCNGTTIPTMAVPTNGDAGSAVGSMISGSREMLMLFCWGAGTNRVHDIDYVTWGDTFEDGTRADKSAVTGYQSDTAATDQLNAAAPANYQSIERCDATENGETQTGGNGALGHDETSEDMSTSFSLNETPTPGATRTCT